MTAAIPETSHFQSSLSKKKVNWIMIGILVNEEYLMYFFLLGAQVGHNQITALTLHCRQSLEQQYTGL